MLVRPGAPNAATTSCYSGVVREPLAGAVKTLPLALDLVHPVASHRTVCKCLVTLAETSAADLAAHGGALAGALGAMRDFGARVLQRVRACPSPSPSSTVNTQCCYNMAKPAPLQSLRSAPLFWLKISLA